METAITVSLILVVLVACILIYAATKPSAFRVERSANIKASPEKIFAIVNDLHNWHSWSPYENRDPAMKKTYSGSASGKGAVYEWNGNSKVGEGRMEIVETAPPSNITMQLDFLRPFEGHNRVVFSFDTQGDSTKVMWAMDGKSAYMMKVMGTFINMDRMIGKDFETGLANLKNIAEK